MAGTAVFQSGTIATPGPGVIVATDPIGGTLWQQVKLDVGPAGTSIPLSYGGTGMPLGTLPGTVSALGTFQPLPGSVHLASGTVSILGTVQTAGTSQVIGTAQIVGTVPVGTIAGTVSILGSVQAVGTSQVLGSVQTVGTGQVIGTVQLVGAVPVGTIAGTVSVGTIAGTVQVLGSVQTVGTSQTLGTVQLVGAVPVGTIAGTVSIGTVAGTVQTLGSVQTVGTSQALGTVQPLAGSVHLASNLAGGTVVSVGSAAHDAAADTRPHLIGAFGSSGTQAAVNDGDAVRLWADLNGRLQIRGTIDQMPAITVSSGTIPGGTVVTQPLVTGAGTYVAARLTDGAAYYTVTGGAVNVADESPFSAGVSAGAPIMGISTVTAIGQGSIGLLAMGSDRVQLVRPYGGTLDGGTQSIVGTVQIRGTIDSMPPISVGTIAGGTIQAFGTTQILGSVQTVGTVSVGTIAGVVQVGTVAGTISVGTIAGTVGVLGTVQTVGVVETEGTVQILGTVPIGTVAGTVSILGTIQSIGTIRIEGGLDIGTLPTGVNPVIIGAVGSSGTLAAVGNGSTQYLWSDLNGRLQIRGTIDSMPAIAIGTISGGTIQAFGTTQVLGTVQIIEAEGTSQVQGYIGAGTLAAGNPVVIGAIGSSGTLAAVGDGSTRYLWSDPSGRLQVRGTIDSFSVAVPIGTVAGTISVGTIASVRGTVDVGTVRGTVSIGTIAGTIAVGTIAGTIAVGTIAGTVSIGTVAGTVQVRPAGVAGESFIGTIYSGAAFSTVAVLVNPASGTFVRLFDIIVSGSAAGTARLEFGSAAGTLISTIFPGDNGGLSFNSSRGVRSPGTSKGVYFSATAGSWGVTINYTLEN